MTHMVDHNQLSLICLTALVLAFGLVKDAFELKET